LARGVGTMVPRLSGCGGKRSVPRGIVASAGTPCRSAPAK
jgi:hypothetical protein